MGVSAGTDKIIFALSLPGDSVLHDIKGEVHVIGTADQLYRKGTFYGLNPFPIYLAI